MQSLKVHLDTDLGGDIDDICALAYLLRSPHVEITGITVVGDTGGKRTGYTKYTLELDGRNEIPVKAGAETFQGHYRHELGLPDETRYWPEPIPPSPNPTSEAIQLLKSSIDQGAIVIGIGPYTNLSLLEKSYPGILKRTQLFLMGGFIYPLRHGYPDWKNEFDFNVQVDIQSSKHVLQNSQPTLVPLAVTAQTALRRCNLKRLNTAGQLGKLLARQAEEFAIDEKMDDKYETCEKVPRDIINFQHDPLTCAIATGWNDGVTIQEVSLTIEEKEGWLLQRIDPQGNPVKVVTHVHGEAFSEYWLNCVAED